MQHSSEYKKFIVLQLGNRDVEALVWEYEDENTEILEIDGSSRSPLQNMNFNRWTAFEKAFGEYGADWILSLEEDIEVAPETLIFVESVYKTYRNNPKFRGINLGSVLRNNELSETFSLQRFGVHGCGTVMTRSTWEKLKFWRIKDTLGRIALDGALEGFSKSGFMVTPNITMYLDNGWDSGTHTKGTGKEPHYVSNRESWQIRLMNQARTFRELPIEIPWRNDCIPYDDSQDLQFMVHAIYLRLRQTTIINLIFHYLKKFKAQIISLKSMRLGR